MKTVVRETGAMLASMNPVLGEGQFVFCTSTDASLLAQAQSKALCWFREEEGVSMVLEYQTALALGLAVSLPMSRIVLEVYSALDGFGLTSAVSSALSAEGIACNMIAAYHHDNVFVPSSLAERAIAILKAIQTQAALAAAR